MLEGAAKQRQWLLLLLLLLLLVLLLPFEARALKERTRSRKLPESEPEQPLNVDWGSLSR